MKKEEYKAIQVIRDELWANKIISGTQFRSIKGEIRRGHYDAPRRFILNIHRRSFLLYHDFIRMKNNDIEMTIRDDYNKEIIDMINNEDLTNKSKNIHGLFDLQTIIYYHSFQNKMMDIILRKMFLESYIQDSFNGINTSLKYGCTVREYLDKLQETYHRKIIILNRVLKKFNVLNPEEEKNERSN